MQWGRIYQFLCKSYSEQQDKRETNFLIEPKFEMYPAFMGSVPVKMNYIHSPGDKHCPCER
jgi:hypothetical protein